MWFFLFFQVTNHLNQSTLIWYFQLQLQFQDRASATEPKGRGGKGGGNRILCRWGNGDYTLQGSNHIQPSSTSTQHSHSTTIWVSLTGRCKGKELDPWLPLPHRPLLVLVWLARLAGTCAEEVPGSPFCHFLHMFLWTLAIPRHCFGL